MKSSIISEQLIKDLLFLTSKETEGRVSGSRGARVTANYLANELASLGMQQVGEVGYFSYLEIHAARLEGPVILSVGTKVLRHRIDFGEISRFSNPKGNNINGELIIVRDGDDIEPPNLKGKVVLIPEIPKSLDLVSTVQGAEEAGVLALLIEGGEPRWFTKSLQGARSQSIPVFRIRRKVVRELENLQGEVVNLQLPLISENQKCQNVLGLMPGKNTSKTLVLSAHYDHLGDDPGGFRFPGAVDNASGVGIILEIARNLARRPLPFNILCAFFTGEESGLLGAKHFVKNAKVPITAAINIDSIGFEPTLNKMRNGHNKPGHWLGDLSAEIIKKHKVEISWISGGEDSRAFQLENIPAIGLGQKPIDPNQRGIHTPLDTFENLYLETVKHGYGIVNDIIEQLIQHPELIGIEK